VRGFSGVSPAYLGVLQGSQFMRSDVHRVLAALAALSTVACAGGLEGAVRTQAAMDLACPEGQMTVRDQRSDNYVRDFEVHGCGKRARYQAACSMVGTCTAYQSKELGEHPQASSDAVTAGVEDLQPAPPLVVVMPDGNTVVAEVVPPPAPEAAPAVEPAVASASPVVPSGEARPVTLRNACPRTVSLFVGPQPGAEGGRYMTLGSNSSISPRLQAGEQLWLLDEKQGGTASVSISDGTREVEIAESCGGLTAR
jgi:hypothetical protein